MNYITIIYILFILTVSSESIITKLNSSFKSKAMENDMGYLPIVSYILVVVIIILYFWKSILYWHLRFFVPKKIKLEGEILQVENSASIKEVESDSVPSSFFIDELQSTSVLYPGFHTYYVCIKTYKKGLDKKEDTLRVRVSSSLFEILKNKKGQFLTIFGKKYDYQKIQSVVFDSIK